MDNKCSKPAIEVTFKKVIIFIFSIDIWIVVLGAMAYRIGEIVYSIFFFVNTLFFIVLSQKIAKNAILRIFLITFSIGGSLFVATYLESYLLEQKLYTFDINHDKIFSGSEHTEEQQKYFRRLVNDGNRLFTYLIAFPYALTVAVFSTVLVALIKLFRKGMRK
jgi:hypothetical protein